MTMHFRELAEHAAADGAISPGEILALRREGWSDGEIAPEQAEAIFAINDRLKQPSRDWTDFFVEALTEYVVNQMEPKGYVTDGHAEWLIARIGHDGRIDSMAELELLAKIFEKATSVPESLRDFALREIEQAVLTGTGPTHCGGSLATGCVSEAEVRLLRRFVFASGGARPAGVSREEAEMLYRLKDACLGAANAPGWKQLFVQGVGNYLLGPGGSGQLPRERAVELEAFMNDTRPSVGGFFSRMGRSAGRGKRGPGFGRKRPAAEPGVGLAEARAVTPVEQGWLQEHIDANRQVDEFDQALIDFIAEEQGLRAS